MRCATRWEFFNAIARHLQRLAPDQIDALRGKLRIGVHSDVEATETVGPNRLQVSQALCSALPVAYSRVPPPDWELFASLVLEAAYEATNVGRGPERRTRRQMSFS